MPCPTCAALNREHSHECEAEASATIKQRSELTASCPTDPLTLDQLDQEVLRSRKRQAHIAFELRQHRAKHGEMATAASR
jgi:hypothetical protein